MSINRVIITGNLTRDPELRSTASGMPVLGFGVAVNDRRRNQQTGEWEDYPNFIDCTMFGARAPMQQSAPQPQAMPVQQAPAPVATPVVDASVYDEDIPF